MKIKEISAEFFIYNFNESLGDSTYKQKYRAPCSNSDASFLSTLIITLGLQPRNHSILWNNRAPHSARFCKPLKLEYDKESTKHILKEKQYIY